MGLNPSFYAIIYLVINMKLKVSFDNEINTIVINTTDDLKKELLEYSGYFIPEEDDYAIDLLEKNYFDELIDELDGYFAQNFFIIAKDYFTTIKEIYESNSMDFIISKLDLINSICDKAGLDLKYEII